jgi:hypothetical protein
MDIIKGGIQNLKGIGFGAGVPELRDAIFDTLDPKSAALSVYQQEQEKEKKTRQAQGMKKGGAVKAKSGRGDGCAIRGKTKGRMI